MRRRRLAGGGLYACLHLREMGAKPPENRGDLQIRRGSRDASWAGVPASLDKRSSRMPGPCGPLSEGGAWRARVQMKRGAGGAGADKSGGDEAYAPGPRWAAGSLCGVQSPEWDIALFWKLRRAPGIPSSELTPTPP